MTPQEAEFAARLARIEAGGASRRATIFVGLDESYVIDRTRSVRASGAATLLGNAGYPLSIMVAFFFGCVAYATGRLLRFHMSGAADTPFTPDVEMAIDLATGLMISLLFSQIDGMRLSEQKIAKTFGVIFGMLTFHNLVHMYPDIFTRLFSELWVSKLIVSTKAYSLLWRGISFTF